MKYLFLIFALIFNISVSAGEAHQESFESSNMNCHKKKEMVSEHDREHVKHESHEDDEMCCEEHGKACIDCVSCDICNFAKIVYLQNQSKSLTNKDVNNFYIKDAFVRKRENKIYRPPKLA